MNRTCPAGAHEGADRQLRLGRSLGGVRTRETAMLGTLLAWLDPEVERGDHEGAANLIVGDLIVCEVLRGIPDPRGHAAVKDALLSFEVVTIGGLDLALAAADHYRALRRLGVTVRKTIDLLIGIYRIAKGCALLHSDRDLDSMTRHLGLRAF